MDEYLLSSLGLDDHSRFTVDSFYIHDDCHLVVKDKEENIDVASVRYVKGDSPSGYIVSDCDFKLKIPFNTALVACNIYISCSLKKYKNMSNRFILEEGVNMEKDFKPSDQFTMSAEMLEEKENKVGSLKDFPIGEVRGEEAEEFLKDYIDAFNKAVSKGIIPEQRPEGDYENFVLDAFHASVIERAYSDNSKETTKAVDVLRNYFDCQEKSHAEYKKVRNLKVLEINKKFLTSLGYNDLDRYKSYVIPREGYYELKVRDEINNKDLISAKYVFTPYGLVAKEYSLSEGDIKDVLSACNDYIDSCFSILTSDIAYNSRII